MNHPDNAAFLEHLKALIDSDQPSGQVQLPDGEMMRFEKGATPETLFAFSIPGVGGFTTRVFEAAESKPDGYPAELPFMPNERVTVTEANDSFTANWWSVADVGAFTSQLVAACNNEGWTKTESNQLAAVDAQIQNFTRAGTERSIVRAGPMVTLIARRARLAP